MRPELKTYKNNKDKYINNALFLWRRRTWEEEEEEEGEGMHSLRWCANNDIIQPTSVFVLRVICWYLHDGDDFALLPNRYMYQLAWPGTPRLSFRLLPLVTRHQRAEMPTAVVNDRVHYLLNSQANPLLWWAQKQGGVSVLLSAE